MTSNILLVQAMIAGLTGGIDLLPNYTSTTEPKKPNLELEAAAQAKRDRKNAKRKTNASKSTS